jgi:hypothetical protein
MTEFPSIHNDDLIQIQNNSGISISKINDKSVDLRKTGAILDNIVQRKTKAKYDA